MFRNRWLVTALCNSPLNTPAGAGMSTRPSYYSGRGARRGDLDGQKLQILHAAIKANVNDDAAQAFAQMVADIPKLSATDFLIALAKLEGHDWKWDKALLGKEKGIYAEDEGSVMGTIFSVMSGMDECDETESIRNPFFWAIKFTPLVEKRLVKRVIDGYRQNGWRF